MESVEDILAELPVLAKPRAMAVPAPAPTLAAELRQPSPPRKEATPKPIPAVQALTPAERTVYETLSPEGAYVDEIALACRLSISEALSSLTLLELKGLVKQLSGKRFAPV